MKPGYKTTEFWFTTIATLIALFLASGLAPEGSVWVKVAALAYAGLAKLGYSMARGSAKSATILSETKGNELLEPGAS